MRLHRCPRPLALAVLLSIALAVPAAAQSLTPDDVRLLRESQQALDDGRFEAAAGAARSFLKKHPDHGDALRLLGHALRATGQRDEARRTLMRALGRGRLTPDVIAGLAQLDRERGAAGAVSAAANLLVLLEPDNAAWQALLAESLVSRGAYAEAERVYATLLERDPADAMTWGRRANVAMHRGDDRAAAIHLETAAHLGLVDDGLATRLATLWVRVERAAKALDWLRRAETRGERPTVDLRIAIARRLSTQRRGDDAIALLDAALPGSDDRAAANLHRALAAIHARAGRLDDVRRHLRRAAAAGPEDAATLRYLALDATRRDQHGEASGYWERAVAAAPTKTEYLAPAITSLIRAGHTTRARALLVVYLEHHGRDDRAIDLIRRLARR